MMNQQKLSKNCRRSAKTFAYDHCFWSVDETDAHYASQARVFHSLGHDVLDNAFDGYNACMFAYGQTGRYGGFGEIHIVKYMDYGTR